ncbi:MAG: hypothetical protein ABIB47_02680 [Candidatus Woesearchaeota archaeon]
MAETVKTQKLPSTEELGKYLRDKVAEARPGLRTVAKYNETIGDLGPFDEIGWESRTYSLKTSGFLGIFFRKPLLVATHQWSLGPGERKVKVHDASLVRLVSEALKDTGWKLD